MGFAQENYLVYWDVAGADEGSVPVRNMAEKYGAGDALLVWVHGDGDGEGLDGWRGRGRPPRRSLLAKVPALNLFEGLGFRVWGIGHSVQGVGCRV